MGPLRSSPKEYNGLTWRRHAPNRPYWIKPVQSDGTGWKDAVGNRDKLERLLADLIGTVRRRKLLVDPTPASGAKFVQQTDWKASSERDDVDIRDADRNTVETVRP